VFGVDLRYGPATNSNRRIIHGKTTSAISGHPDIPCFLLLDDPANELFLSAGLGAGRILTPAHPKITLSAGPFEKGARETMLRFSA
jgi:hypothetical protein